MQIKHLHREYKIRGKQSLIESHLCSVLQNHTSLCTNCFPIVPIWKHQKHISNVLLSPFVHFLLSVSGCVLAAVWSLPVVDSQQGWSGLYESLVLHWACFFRCLHHTHLLHTHTQTHSICGQSQTRVTLNNFTFSCILIWCFKSCETPVEAALYRTTASDLSHVIYYKLLRFKCSETSRSWSRKYVTNSRHINAVKTILCFLLSPPTTPPLSKPRCRFRWGGILVRQVHSGCPPTANGA